MKNTSPFSFIHPLANDHNNWGRGNSIGPNTIFLFVVVLLLYALPVSGQDTIKSKFTGKTIDFKKKGIDKDEAFRVQVKGVNSVLHHTAFKFKDFQWVSKLPEGLKILVPGMDSNQRTNGYKIMATTESIKTSDFPIIAKLFIEGYDDLLETGKEIDTVWQNPKLDIPKKKDLIILKSKTRINDWISMLNKNVIKEYGDVDRSNFFFFTLEKTGHVLNYYENLKEQNQGVSGINRVAADELARLEPFYTSLKTVRPKIMSALAALIEGAGGTIESKAISEPHFPKKDLTNVEIYLVNRFNPADTLTRATADLFVRNRFRIDFSTGLSANTLVQREFFFTKSADVVTDIDSEQSAGLDLGIAALVHLDWKVRTWLAIGPALGASFSLIDEKPRYILGLSGSFGKERSISLTLGANLGKQQVLSNQVSSDGENYDGTSELSPFESPPLTSKIKTGFFIGITYNVTRSRKE
ncbi:hypothetical protein RQM65_10625 [Pricia sp. S334]|uniref:DUF5723 domain-containing protein n=1 Tax=Pricia mediterranea TaxID=3076079 RepID=A0ABU3L7G6_9FLAO|nr:hypothetical protein [Pricia sp. S334]MDT7829119.1 hypothetical protein [Pricia sp. S334]